MKTILIALCCGLPLSTARPRAVDEFEEGEQARMGSWRYARIACARSTAERELYLVSPAGRLARAKRGDAEGLMRRARTEVRLAVRGRRTPPPGGQCADFSMAAVRLLEIALGLRV